MHNSMRPLAMTRHAGRKRLECARGWSLRRGAELVSPLDFFAISSVLVGVPDVSYYQSWMTTRALVDGFEPSSLRRLRGCTRVQLFIESGTNNIVPAPLITFLTSNHNHLGIRTTISRYPERLVANGTHAT